MHRWIRRLMEGMDSEVDEETRTRILEDCGRNCIPLGFIEKMKAVWEEYDLDGLLENINNVWASAGANAYVKRRGDRIYAEFGDCYCPIVQDYPEELSSSWCNCSRGWLLELFESVFGRTVEVELEKSIKQGDEICKFRIIF